MRSSHNKAPRSRDARSLSVSISIVDHLNGQTAVFAQANLLCMHGWHFTPVLFIFL